MDIIRDLGSFALASRLKRLSDKLKQQASAVYTERGIEFNDSWFLVGYMLSKNEGMTMTEMANALGISPPAISQVSVEMVKKGIVVLDTDITDRRRKIMTLTPKGKRIVKALEPIWDMIAAVTDSIITSSGEDLLSALAAFEDELDKSSLIERVNKKYGAPK